MDFGGGTSGQWVRARDEEGAKLFVDEQARDNPVPRRTPRQRRILIGVSILAIAAVALILLLG